MNDLNAMRYIVRRLTPTEAERLMGLPDGYTIPVGLRAGFADGAPSPSLVAEFQRIHDTFGAIMAEYEHRHAPKPKSANQVRAWLEKITDPATCPDSPRYKACGNGWATNQPRWILTRLLAIGEHIDPFTGEEDAPCS
jgi:site-specific DNA-cytosine methylase